MQLDPNYVDACEKEIRDLTTKLEAAEAAAKTEYKRGYENALRQYAWMKDGVQYVGCGVWTLAQALRDAGID